MSTEAATDTTYHTPGTVLENASYSKYAMDSERESSDTTSDNTSDQHPRNRKMKTGRQMQRDNPHRGVSWNMTEIGMIFALSMLTSGFLLAGYHCYDVGDKILWAQRYDEITHHIKDLEQKTQRREVAAFMAGIKPHSVYQKHQVYHGGDDIKFNLVHTNVGGWYDPESGKFSCRENGLYQFSVSIRAMDPNHMAWIEIVKDGKVFGRVHVNKMATREDLVQDLGLTGSSLFTIECEKNSKVWVRAGSWDDFQGEVGFFCGLSDEAYTSFSGILISVLGDD